MPDTTPSPVLRLRSRGVARALGELEAEVMGVLWNHGEPMSTRDVSLGVGRHLSLNTVRTVLNNLVRKGIVVRQGRRRSFLFRPAVDRHAFASGMLDQVFRGLVEDFGDLATVGFLRATERTDPEGLARLFERLKERLGEGRGPSVDD